MSNIEELRKIYAKHAPFDVHVDLSHLDPKRKEIVKKLIQATDIVDGIYWKQANHDALDWRKRYANPKTDDEKLIHELIEMNCGPYDRLNFNTAFIGDKPKRAPGAGFYPEDLTKEEFEAYVAKHPEKKEAFESPFTVIKRKGKELEAVWYHDEYKTEVTQIVKLLTECAELTEEPTLKRYLLQRAEDLQTDNYYKSDCDWIDLNDPYIDVVIGPCEPYTDNLNGIKTGYQAILMLKNREASEKLSMFLNLIDRFERVLPIDNKYKKKNGAKLDTPMFMVDTVYRGGDARRTVQFVAFSLPNDPKVLSEKGSKKMMHRNFLDARFDNIIFPVSKCLMAAKHHPHLNATSYADFVLFHEFAHSFGLGFVYGTSITINSALKEHFNPLDELRSNLLSIYCQLYLTESGTWKDRNAHNILTAYIATEIRSLRIGHGAYSVAATIVFNYCAENGGVRLDDGKVGITDYKAFEACLKNLTRKISTIIAEGDYNAAKNIIENYNRKTDVTVALSRDISNIPIELWPKYPLVQKTRS